MTRGDSKKGSELDRTLGLVATALGIVGLLWPPKTGAATTIWLVALFLLLIHPVFRVCAWLLEPKWKGVAPAVASSLLLGSAVAAFGLMVWPAPRRHDLDEQERKAFEGPLVAQKQEPKSDLVVACPANDEGVCVYASQFVEMFREAGWTVRGNQVERGALGNAKKGVLLIQRGIGTPDPAVWNAGVWALISPSIETLREAFNKIGVEPDNFADAALQENVIRVYFGPEKDKPGERTSLSGALDQLEVQRRSGAVPSRKRGGLVKSHLGR